MALDEDAQRSAKLDVLRQALERTGRLRELPAIELCRSPTDLAYRSRARFHFDAVGRMGFFARASRELVETNECAVLSAELARAVRELDEVRRRAPEAFSVFSEVELRVLGEARSSCFTLRAPLATVPAASRAALRELGARFSVQLLPASALERSSAAPKPAAPRDRLPLAGGLHLLAAPGDFTQVNWGVNRALIEELTRGAKARRCETFLDLFSGAGNFALPLLELGLSGVAVENSASSIAGARQAAVEQGFSSAEFVHADVAAHAAALDAAGARFDLVVMDPPRAGMPQGIQRVAALVRRALFLCYCDPVTFARDLRRFVDLGFAVESLTVFDMFPQTHHFEVTAWLRPAPHSK